jgi:hypothetical protein
MGLFSGLHLIPGFLTFGNLVAALNRIGAGRVTRLGKRFRGHKDTKVQRDEEHKKHVSHPSNIVPRAFHDLAILVD